MKSEPAVFSFEDLRKRPRSTDHWEGVRNYQARNYMKEEMRKGDKVLFYHSNCEVPGVVGIAEVSREAYPDFSSWDPKSRYYDPKSTPEDPRWFMVDVTWEKVFRHTVTLKDLRAHPKLRGMKVLQRGQRLSVMPVTKEEFDIVAAIGLKEEDT
ncbi:MAG TPA: EVE domain-containing protein [Thermodesulfovibrionales bacterium]|nr:EVE domain-containing protein [Thermodesulfovibrionales bacterium]